MASPSRSSSMKFAWCNASHNHPRSAVDAPQMSLIVRPGLEIPDADLEVAFVRSAGPGGQNVNKVASAVQLRFALDRNVTLHPDVKARLRILAGQRLNDAGEVLIVARESRSQEQNRRTAEQKLLDLVR